MNVTELARRLKVDTSELLEKLPLLGFDIGRRAIKVDDRLAQKIVQRWHLWHKEKRDLERLNKIRGLNAETEEEIKLRPVVKIPPVIAVKEFANRLNLPVNNVLMELMQNGIMSSLNERIDFETATIIAQDLGFITEPEVGSTEELIDTSQKVNEVVQRSQKLSARPPVVVVMGHVDHGKTKLLDTIRTTKVMEGEAGGITQHIGAYQVEKNGRMITFIDTPGHEAFTAMRSRGAKAADIAILVVAADDGVQPQTIEACTIAQAAKIPIVVAINKIDKPEANVEKTKQEISAKLNLIPEDYGGKTICVPISARTNQNIDQLLEMVLLTADLEKEKIVADVTGEFVGTIIESHIDKGEGPVATLLVQNGQLKVNDNLCDDEVYYGKVKALKDFRGQALMVAGPATPVRVLGFKLVPQVGDVISATKDISKLDKKLKQKRNEQEKNMWTPAVQGNTEMGGVSFNLILKGDVLGSVEAILQMLAAVESPEVKIKIVAKGLGSISEADILKAESTKAQLYGFNVKPTTAAENLAKDKGVVVKQFSVIYHLLEDVKKEVEKLLAPEIISQKVGEFKVKAIFRQETKAQIIGGSMVDGKVSKGLKAIVIRNGQPVTDGLIGQVQMNKQEVSEVKQGQECGLKYEGKPLVQVGDLLEFYSETRKEKKLQ
ncbi:MAG: translation initiation factor IF-2 [Candidatus Buchananbacteria bacterium]